MAKNTREHVINTYTNTIVSDWWKAANKLDARTIRSASQAETPFKIETFKDPAIYSEILR